MIVGDSFDGDSNEILKWVQHDIYWTLLPLLFSHPKDLYLKALRYAGVETDLSGRINDIAKFDHRVLQNAHDKIAAYYRYEFPDKSGQLVIPATIPDCESLNLEDTLKESYKREWVQFWYSEIRKLSSEPVITRAILTAIAYQNTDEGYEAEDLLLELLHDKYGKSWDYQILNNREMKRKTYENNMILSQESEEF